MGAPELPNDPGDDDLRTTHIVHHPPAPSDDSDNESLLDAGAYDGYQPLAMDENHIDYSHNMRIDDASDDVDDNDNGDVHIREGFSRIPETGGIEEDEVVHGDTNMPPIEPADVEIERQVWSQPRPQELQIELDGNKTQQVREMYFLGYKIVCDV